MKKILPYILLIVCCLAPAINFAQSAPKIKIDGVAASADPVSGIKLPYWLNATQTLAADQDVTAISVMEFTINGTSLDFSQVLNVTTVQTVPAGKIWKMESISFPASANTPTNWGTTGNGSTTPGTNFVGTTDNKDLVLKANNVEGIRVTPAGNIGINNPSPTAKLDVAGSVKIVDGTQANGKVLTSNASGAATWQSPGVLQVVYSEVTSVIAGSAGIPLDNTIPQITEGSEFITATITPKSATSFLLVQVTTWMSECTNTSDYLMGALFRDSGADAIAAGFADLSHNTVTVGAANNYSDGPFVITKRVPANSTAATTFRFRAGANAGPVEINRYGGTQYLGGSITTTMTITEIGN